MNRLDEFISDYKITVFDIGGMSMVMAGDKTYEEVVKKIHLQGEDKEGMNVSKWMQQIKRESLEEGVMMGEEKGRREGEA